MPQLDALQQQQQQQQHPAGRSVEVDVQRLADIRTSLQNIQRRKSAPFASSSSSDLSTVRHGTHASPSSAQQQAAENMFQPLHAASSALFPVKQQPFAQRDLNREIKVCHQHLAQLMMFSPGQQNTQAAP